MGAATAALSIPLLSVASAIARAAGCSPPSVYPLFRWRAYTPGPAPVRFAMNQPGGRGVRLRLVAASIAGVGSLRPRVREDVRNNLLTALVQA